MVYRSPSPKNERRWRLLYELVEDLSRQRSGSDAIDTIMRDAPELVPGDRGLSMIKMEGRIPFCVRWPEYANCLVPQFNRYLNRRSPMYYDPPYTVLNPVDWFTYRESEYHAEFNVPLGIRYSVGVGIRDESSHDQYALFVHRSPGDAPFRDTDVAALSCIREPISNLLTLIGESSRGFERRVWEREADPRCDILSPREREIAQLICRRLTMRAIACHLGISPRTVERHALHIYQKLDIPGRRALIRLCGNPDEV